MARTVPQEADPKVDAWMEAAPAAHRDLLVAARALIGAALPDAREAIKWGYPTWVGNGNIVALVPYADHVNLQFHQGAHLADPAGLLEGTGKGLRHVKVRHARDLKGPRLAAILRSALRRDREGAEA
jgi:hypothetical protein